MNSRLSKKQSLLNAIAKEIENCRLCKTGKIGKAVPGEGNADAEVAFIGEAPGKKEAATGQPFVGRSGQLLRSLIRKIGLKEKDVFITSPVKYLPVYKTPKKKDIEHGRIHLLEQLDVIQPKVVVLLGSVAAQGILDEKIPTLKKHGTVIDKNGRKNLITLHPAAAIRFPPLKRMLVKDFNKLKKIMAVLER